MIEIYALWLLGRTYSVQKLVSWLKVEMKSPRMSRDVLYVPLYLRSFNISEKIIVASLIFISSLAVALVPLLLSSIQTPEPSTTMIYGGEAGLWGILGEKK